MRYVYFFGEGNRDMKAALGGKGAGLHEMTRIGIPVPPGFTITTDTCVYYFKHGDKLPEGLKREVEDAQRRLEGRMEKKFGDLDNPLLVSVRSGARVSMPGMMDTILNLGLNKNTVKGLIKNTGNERFAYDCYRRLIDMYGNVVMAISHGEFEEALAKLKKEKGAKLDSELSSEALRELTEIYENIIKRHGKTFPEDPFGQLWGAIGAVFKSWNNERAKEYRRLNNISDDWGTACNVQSMVFGNMGEDSMTGVAFTRNPATGENVFYGEWLQNAQGEDVVAGIRTPHPLSKAERGMSDSSLASLEEMFPDTYGELSGIRDKLENHYRDVQDIEFTMEKGKLFILQTRTGKRTPLAAVKIAVDMTDEKLISKEEAIMRVDPRDIDLLLHPMVDPYAKVEVISRGLPASPGAATGKVVFSSEDAVRMKEKGEGCILVRIETSPEDIKGMASAEGILTQRGGMTSHAAVVARGMGKPCIAGCESINIDYARKLFKKGDCTIKEGDVITIDGATGRVMEGDVKKIKASLTGEFGRLLSFADEVRRLGVKTNADTPNDAKTARDFGCEGIGLCRTEHMFFGGERIKAVREMIVAETREEREKALAKILPMQREDFKGIFRVMDGLPVIIRTLDPPLHEFLPKGPKAIEELAKEMNVEPAVIEEKARALSETNPMLGHRGCRLGITYPEITEMQVRAIFEAACDVTREGKKVIPEVMIPLVGSKIELENQRKVVEKVAEEVMKERGVKINYMVGTMIELPRAALTAGEIAEIADFFSYGTNDLTQTTFGFSRDDVAKILDSYIENGILNYDPFQTLDERGVGELIKIGLERGKKTNPKLEVGICGEHGGDPKSIDFCERVGLDYVSCSPYRVPTARLAAAQAKIRNSRK
ncbi:pyruvate, phosphate dikinase [candidate division WOR-3 bacterium JGI_Cruoil_03_44_89]|uniref:Pyruvate, phosphate dikinase n=1 Tax=candidate division WOR-3 bacterium JGI_Cruoil_03_44_89 TaxID=1973748 RepID=A0A235BYH7_UNCW3|nr:MAG: pyruvate, phosphate dikinase [candidate division WOR-3 bacterium JGI_Cruoil_03_44_89]